MKRKFIANFVALVVAFGFASIAEAAPTKNKGAHKRASISQMITNYSCEGRVGTTSGTLIGGFNRDENSISFIMSVNRMNGVATIMQAQGSRLIKSGRYAFSGSGGVFSINIPWTDYNGVGQYFDLYIASDGTFSGKAMSSNPVNIGTALIDEIFGPDGRAFKPQTSYSVEGICWK